MRLCRRVAQVIGKRKPAREVFWALLLKRDSFCGPILRRCIPLGRPRFDKTSAAPFSLQ